MEAKVNELRIGNWVQDEDESNLQHQVETITKSDGIYFINGRIYHDILAIPLTEEWLVKLGLITDDTDTSEALFEVLEDGSKWYYWVEKGTFNLEINKKREVWIELYSHYKQIKYVHELQNLFFALTGEELKLK